LIAANAHWDMATELVSIEDNQLLPLKLEAS
jgi:hypothetical protein